MTKQPLTSSLRPASRDLPESGIVELANAGRLKEDLIRLWVGEGHQSTPDFICEAANRSMLDGETFYTWQRGIPELREALATYHRDLYPGNFDAERFFVTGSGMQAVQLTLQALAGGGDEVIIPMPAWPNIESAAKIGGAHPVGVALRLENGVWRLDLNDIEAVITDRTRAIFINSPSNPTGWTADEEFLKEVLALVRRHNLWIIADEVYNRFYFPAERAPSFYDIMEDDDRIIFVNTFSKNWAMTGWRVGWIAASPSLGDVFENLIQFSTSGVAAFMQRGAVAALERGDAFLSEQIAMARQSRDIVCDALAETGKVHFQRPEGAFYLFFSIDGVTDSREIALRLIEEAGVGLAPGSAFGPHNQSFFRLCFARAPEDIQRASDRLAYWLTQNI